MDTNNNNNNNDDDDESSSQFLDLYTSLVFLICLFLAGDVFCGRLLKIVPSLVGQICVGIIFGPSILNWVSLEWQTLGEIGLVLLLVQAGIEMDYETLTQIGLRGTIMAVVGSILPMTIGFCLSYFVLGLNWESAIAVGASFGPTSAGIAMNVLEQCNALKTQVGQLIVAIAIVDDIFALVVLSQLRALTGDEIIPSSIVVPIISALLWLGVGGYTALYIMPKVFDKLTRIQLFGHDRRHQNGNDNKEEEDQEGVNNDSTSISAQPSPLWHVGILLFALLPATYYSQASYLMGAFLAGLSVCQQPPGAALKYNQQLSKIIQWLMRIFFGATIASRIPVLLLNDATIIGQGFLLSLSLLGKVMTGPLLTPILDNNKIGTKTGDDGTTGRSRGHSSRRRWDRDHARDCAMVGFSMAGEAEFAFVVAAFGLEEGLLTEQLYASVAFAILLSTILSPVLLRTTLALFPITVAVCKKTTDEKEDTAFNTSDDVDLDEASNNINADTMTATNHEQQIENYAQTNQSVELDA